MNKILMVRSTDQMIEKNLIGYGWQIDFSHFNQIADLLDAIKTKHGTYGNSRIRIASFFNLKKGDIIVFQLDESIDQALWDELDELYDQLSAQDQALLEDGTEDEGARSTAGIYLQLMDGRQTVAQVDPDTVNRILSVLNMDEFNAFLETIVRSVEQPDDSPVCQRVNA